MAVAAVVADLLASPTASSLRQRYREPWRHYHDWTHPLAMIGHLAAAERDGVSIEDPVAAVGFVLWHDAIYDPQAAPGRNERLSAELCRHEMPAVADPASVDRAVAAVLATIDHQVPGASECPDGALLLDIDLAILGASDTDFDHYDAAIAAEYAHVPPEAYRSGRAAVLHRFLDRDRLFVTDWGRARWEQPARANLRRSIASVQS
jgi:predicted metal-dependent HD superfamily phosphohydrolase